MTVMRIFFSTVRIAQSLVLIDIIHGTIKLQYNYNAVKMQLRVSYNTVKIYLQYS